MSIGQYYLRNHQSQPWLGHEGDVQPSPGNSEESYYILFATLFFLRGRTRVIAAVLVILILGPKILAKFPLWLLGFLTYRLCVAIGRRPIPWAVGLGLFAGSLVCVVGFAEVTERRKDVWRQVFAGLLRRVWPVEIKPEARTATSL